MKQLIIMCSMIFLGLFIYNLLVGAEDGSMLNTLQHVWKNEIDVRTVYP